MSSFFMIPRHDSPTTYVRHYDSYLTEIRRTQEACSLQSDIVNIIKESVDLNQSSIGIYLHCFVSAIGFLSHLTSLYTTNLFMFLSRKKNLRG